MSKISTIARTMAVLFVEDFCLSKSAFCFASADQMFFDFNFFHPICFDLFWVALISLYLFFWERVRYHRKLKYLRHNTHKKFVYALPLH